MDGKDDKLQYVLPKTPVPCITEPRSSLLSYICIYHLTKRPTTVNENGTQKSKN